MGIVKKGVRFLVSGVGFRMYTQLLVEKVRSENKTNLMQAHLYEESA